MRHGKAGAGSPHPDDGRRPLNAAGKAEAAEISAALARAGIAFDFVASSPLSRAVQTAEIVAPGRKGRRRVELWDELKPEAAPGAALSRIAGLQFGPSALLVGHEPGLGALVGSIMAAAGPAARAGRAPPSLAVKKGGMAKLRMLSLSPAPRGQLRWLATPRQLRRLA